MISGMCLASLISVTHFARRAEQGAIVHLLEGAASEHRPLDLSE